jgi:hypothetical protein
MDPPGLQAANVNKQKQGKPTKFITRAYKKNATRKLAKSEQKNISHEY